MLSRYYINERGEVWSVGKYAKPLGGYRCKMGWTFSDYVKTMLAAKTFAELGQRKIDYQLACKCFPIIYLDFYMEQYFYKLQEISIQEVRQANARFNY